ncbi:hypothetical protein OESDEN_22500, partial [Oesophagostomum dentatum]
MIELWSESLVRWFLRLDFSTASRRMSAMTLTRNDFSSYLGE